MLDANPKAHIHPVVLLSFILGFTSILSQVILLRELITVFYGNETTYSIVLASWLFWIAVGSFLLSRFTSKIRNAASLIGIFFFAVYFLLPSCVIAIRGVRTIMDFQAGEIIGIIPMCIASYILPAPLTIALGGLFSLICRYSEEHQGVKTSFMGMIYLWEAVGAATGGLLFSFVFIHVFSAMQIVFLTGMMNLCATVFLWQVQKKPFKAIAVFSILATLLSYPTGFITILDQLTRRIQWQDFDIIANVDSIYGNITLTKLDDEYSLFENGLLSYSTRDPLTNEEKTHYPLLEHPHPKNVLLIGNSIGGSLREILKHPIENITYVELDPMVIRISQEYLPKSFLTPLSDRRVQTIFSDGRFFVKRTQQTYDVIIVNLPDPSSALINRYYSLEFFKEVHGILNPRGILALSVSSSENYLNKEAQMFLRSLNTTLKKVFKDVRSIPGDTNIFLACKDSDVLTYQPTALLERLKERNIATQFVREYYVPFKLSADRIAYIEEVLKTPGTLNTDRHPIAYFYDIILWSTHFDTISKEILEKISWIRLPYLMVIPAMILIVGWLLRKKVGSSPITISIITTGLSEIIFQLVVILAFQTLYGYAYYKIGLIMASFMGGLALGSFAAKKMMSTTSVDPSKIYRIYSWTQLAISLYPLLLPLVFFIFKEMVASKQAALFASIFATLPIVAGFIGGLQYPLATHLLSLGNRNKNKDIAEFAGGLYAADTLGATMGALVTGAVLIPLLGIVDLTFLCAAINVTVLVLLLASPYPRSLSSRL